MHNYTYLWLKAGGRLSASQVADARSPTSSSAGSRSAAHRVEVAGRAIGSASRVLARRPRRDASADAAHPRLRGAGVGALPRRRGARLRPPVDRAGGVGRRRLLAAAADRRDHVDPSRSRPLPRQGPRSARHVRRADGRATAAPTGVAAARCTSPTPRSGSSAPTASSAPACRSPSARRRRRNCAPTAASPSPSSATAPSPRARSTKP